MTNQELRKILHDFPKYPDCKHIKPASVCNSGFPSSFNLSFGEPEMHEQFKQYLDYSHDLIYSKIQPCIRHQDWEIILNDKQNRYRYLSLFDMADVGGLIIKTDPGKQDEITKFSIDSMMLFFNKIGLDKNKIKIAYFVETPIEQATNGKYKINKVFPTDPMIGYWKEKYSLKDEQLIPNQNRDTMLALNVFGLPTPWGYRNEVFYEHDNKLWDIGTMEYLPYRPVFDQNGEIIDIEKQKHSFAISAIGVERVLTILNNFKNVWEIDTIKPLIDLVSQFSEEKNDINAMIVAQSLRVLHKINSEIESYSSLNSRRKEYIRGFYRSYFEHIKKLKIKDSGKMLKELLLLNSNLNSFDLELKNSIDKTAKEFILRQESFLNDKSLKAGV